MKPSAKTALSLLFIFCLNLPLAVAETPEQLRQKIRNYTPNGSVILNDESGRPLLLQNAHKLLIPASIIKIITAQAAFDLLGTDFRFKTDFLLTENRELYIKGWGDPFLISEEISLIAQQLKEKGVHSISRIYLDASSFSKAIQIPGTSHSSNPYDALNGALVVNFNTIYVYRNRNGAIESAEEVTPLTPLARSKGDTLKPGTRERINLTKNPRESLRYVSELFIALFEQSGIKVQNHRFTEKPVVNSARLIYRHHNTRPLEEIFKGLMRYSNNFIANQVFLVMGGERKGYPATLQNSQTVVRSYLKKKWGFHRGDFFLEEASGISARNRMTAQQMIQVLESFSPYHHLLHPKNGINVKSGTLTGVYNYAGYMTTATGVRPFVIMTNQASNRRDKILYYLQQFNKKH